MLDPQRRFAAIAQASFSNAIITGPSFDAADFEGPASFQFSWSSLAGSDFTTPTFMIEESNDNTLWDQISAKTITMTSAIATIGHVTMSMDILNSNYYRIKVRGSDISGGLVKCLAMIKGRTRP